MVYGIVSRHIFAKMRYSYTTFRTLRVCSVNYQCLPRALVIPKKGGVDKAECPWGTDHA